MYLVRPEMEHTLITYHLRILGFLKCNISHASLQTKQVKFVRLFSSDSRSSWSMKLQWDHMYLLQCGLSCVGSTLELKIQGRLTANVLTLACLSGGQMK